MIYSKIKVTILILLIALLGILLTLTTEECKADEDTLVICHLVEDKNLWVCPGINEALFFPYCREVTDSLKVCSFRPFKLAKV